MSVTSKSNAILGATDPLFPTATIVGELLSVRIEEMHELADIFASIFEALLDKQAIATAREAA
jgi:hypothetical protein